MPSVVKNISDSFKKSAVVDVRSGDTVRVHQKVREGSKERVQVFQGLVIKTANKGSHTNRIWVRRATGGTGVEKSFLLHSPTILKVEVTKRSKVRRNYLTYMRARSGKSARMTGIDFDRQAVNAVVDKKAEEEEAKLAEETAKAAEAEEAKKAAEQAELDKKAEAVAASHEDNASDEAK